ncbi:MAG: IS256 family transposase, partial [Candidatus Rokuibacteriota bacterium]
LGVLVKARWDLRALVVGTGLQVLGALLEEDREGFCGPWHRPQADRRAYRHGHDEGVLVLGGRKVRLERPRVRSVEGEEIELPTWAALRREDPLDERVQSQLVLGVSTRRYGESLEALDGEHESVGVSKSSVSRRFVARTAEQVEAYLSRPLGGVDLPVVMVDGTGLGDHVMVVALGIDRAGRKHILGVVEGTTESEAVCRRLFADLIERGLAVERARLFVIDGGKGLRRAIRTSFGAWAVVQRCQVHKKRNVGDHLPKRRQAWVKAAMSRAWTAETSREAKRKLEDLAAALAAEHPGAAASLREGLEETLTLTALGVQGALFRTLCSTNPIENLQGTIQHVARKVKRWRGGSMALRWAVTGLVEASKKFRRIRGHRGMDQLVTALDALVANNSLDKATKVA